MAASIRWEGGPAGALVLLDQTKLPRELTELVCHSTAEVWEAIKQLRVRGAPAIGIAAAYGVVLGMQPTCASGPSDFLTHLHQTADYLASSRPTAVNLFWALDRMRRRGAELAAEAGERRLAELLREAAAIHEEDRALCRAIGRAGAPLLADGSGVLTHCNAGGLATAEYGTALAVIFTCQDLGKRLHVYVDETRPLLQGARLTAWELVQRQVSATLICDNMAAQVMREGKVQAVIVGADRITANGDAANKIGTYGVAVLARAHGIPFYVAAPSTTFDLALASGAEIPIEQRPRHEVTAAFGTVTAPEEVAVYNPAFDVTPAGLITALITERGLVEPVNEANIRRVLGDAH